MFNTLVYIPSILAYTFITLLVVILGFIVIYVAHKIYTTIYDNLPVAQISSKSFASTQCDTITKHSLSIRTEGPMSRKSKTALRIIVTLEPCFLAYMVFVSKFHKPIRISSSKSNQIFYRNNTSSIDSSIADSQDSINENHLLIKYFDSLSMIPTIRDLNKCDNLNNICCNKRRCR